MTQTQLILMTRWPAAGRCKTRLAETIGHSHAAAIQANLTKHTFMVAKSLAEQNLVDIQLAVSGLGAKAAKRWGNQNGFAKIELQGQGSLGLRMKKQILLAKNHSYMHKKKPLCSVLVIGADIPALSVRDLTCALIELKSHEMVIGPASDGGYWLLGLSNQLLYPFIETWPFCGIPWGSDQVLEMTLHKAEKQGTSVSLLRPQFDIDTLDDLKPWHSDQTPHQSLA